MREADKKVEEKNEKPEAAPEPTPSRLTIEVPTEIEAGLAGSDPVCTCPPGC